ncbi:MAG TPA: hypothetical protein VJ596_08015 [Gemmatimonadaceae bacterium]|nr:hypothetical protein [Gemmatimonadaceae bacterium]
MDGATVPALLATDEDDGTEVFLERGSIEVLSGSSVYRTLRFVDIRPSPSGDVILNTDLEYEGLVTRSRDTLFITYPAYNIDRTDTAFVERDEVTVTLGPIAGSPRRMLRFVRDDEGIYQRRRPALPPTPQ